MFILFCEVLFSTKAIRRTELYYIAHREPASLKTFQSHSVPWKEKSASENSRVFFVTLYAFTEVLYFVRRKIAVAAPRSKGLALLCLSFCPLFCKLLLQELQ